MLGDQTVLIATGTALLLIGISSISVSRNLVKSIMSFQVSVFGANLALFSSGLGYGSHLLSDTFVLLSILVGASVEAVGLAVIVLVYRRYGTLDSDEIRRLRN
ncbi:MAG TPA: NADH-quinone oxidoreductase subunit K [Nitrososphaerales archaeon]|nr:NADH-quinone oxidoreductase subunit K [Nitrososphaerales archaeon]